MHRLSKVIPPTRRQWLCLKCVMWAYFDPPLNELFCIHLKNKIARFGTRVVTALYRTPRRERGAAAWVLGVGICAFEVSAQTLADTPISDTIVVTANRIAQPLSQVLADVSVIERSEIEQAGAGALADVLERLGGIQFTRSGGAGAHTQVFVRGAEARFTAVFIDGVRVDSQAFLGGANWQNMPLSQIERIEILRGPAAAVYGSDAVAGVIQIFTRQGTTKFRPFVSAGWGSYQTRQSDAGFSGSNAWLDYSLSVSKQSSQGFNARKSSAFNPDADGFDQHSITGRLGLSLPNEQRLELTLAQNFLDAQYDSDDQPQSDHHALYTLQAVALNWQWHRHDGQTSQVSVSTSSDSDETRPHDSADFTTWGQRTNWLMQHQYRAGEHQFSGLLEQRQEQFQLVDVLQTTTTQTAAALGYGLARHAHTLQANVRHDRQSQFGSKNTGNLAYGYALNSQWRVSASMASAFRVPSLYARFSPIEGNPKLRPETARHQELGLRYQQAHTELGLVAYQTDLRNLFQSIDNRFESTAKAELKGASLSGQTQWRKAQLRFSWDVQNPRDLQTHTTLAGRARHFANLSLQTQTQGWTWGTELRLVGQTFYNRATHTLPGYGLLHVFANKQVHKDWHLQTRISNLANHAYGVSPNFNAPARSVFVGLKWAPSS